jgi:hypothetical protein
VCAGVLWGFGGVGVVLWGWVGLTLSGSWVIVASVPCVWWRSLRDAGVEDQGRWLGVVLLAVLGVASNLEAPASLASLSEVSLC